MSTTAWQDRTQSATDEQINALCSERMQFFEDELRRHYGIYPACGAEQKFFVLDPSGIPWSEAVSIEGLKYLLHDVELLEDIYKEKKGKHEILLWTGDRINEPAPATAFYASAEIAREIENVRRILPARWHDLHANEKSPSVIAFRPTRLGDTETGGLHANFSAFGFTSDGSARKNLFSMVSGQDSQGINIYTHSPLAKIYAMNLFQLHQESLVPYAPFASSYERYGNNLYAPAKFGIGKGKGDCPIVMRPNKSDDNNAFNFFFDDAFRIENRLAGADANPYMVFSGMVGLFHHTITQNIRREAAHPQDFSFETSMGTFYIPHFDMPDIAPVPIVANRATVMQDSIHKFRQSALLREIHGAELHDAILAQAQSRLREEKSR